MAVTLAKSLVIKQQTAIGWRQFCNGCISKMWSDLQDEYLRGIKLHAQHLNEASWAKQVIKLIWQQYFSCGLTVTRLVTDRTIKVSKNINKKFYSPK
eukprot:14465638-Ditylum_brightwellii.AAC.1